FRLVTLGTRNSPLFPYTTLFRSQVGKVASIEPLPNGQAAIHLAIDPSQMRFIPSNVLVDIASSTVFGAKSVELMPPDQPSAQRLDRKSTRLNSSHLVISYAVFCL